MKYQYDDGGRAAAGFKGTTGDCGVRAIAIATDRNYRDVYDEINRIGKKHGATRGLASSAKRSTSSSLRSAGSGFQR